MAVIGTKYNQLEHEVEIYLDNSFGQNDAAKTNINPNSIVNFSIHTSLSDWVTRGSIVLMYNFENVNSVSDSRTGGDPDATTSLSNNSVSPYIFRNDGYDLLRVRITPKSRPAAEDITQTILPIEDRKFWSISHLFSIYDREDINMPPGGDNAAANTIKCIKLYFWDCWYQKMITSNIEYSTALSTYADIERDKSEGKYSNYGVIPTGRAIKEVIDIGLSQRGIQEGYVDESEVSFELSPTSPYKPTASLLGDEWEEGVAKIFYTAPVNASVYDSLQYLYSKHISEGGISRSPTRIFPRGGAPGSSINDFSLLYKEKGPNEFDTGYLTLKPISTYFEKAGSSVNSPGDYQIEHFFLTSYTNESGQIGAQLRAPISAGNDGRKDIKTIKYHTITNYRFVDISALTNATEFCNKPVYSVNFKERTFNTEFKNNDVLTARELISKKYISSLYKNSSNSEKLFLPVIHRDKKDKNIKSVFSLDGDNVEIRQSAGLQQLLKIGLFQNLCINFRTLGLTYRVPGRFIGIDKTQGVLPGEFEDKFFGQWFIIDVKHIFEAELYFNDITAVKIHRFAELPINFSGTIDEGQ